MIKSSQKTPAVVVGLEKNGLGVARALAQAKIPCICLATPSWNPAWKTNTCRLVVTREWRKDIVVEDLIRLGQTFEAKAPLLITKDEPVLWVSEARAELEPYFQINLPDKETVNLLMDKRLFTEMAIKEGWPIPFTWFVDTRDQLMTRLEEVIYPCILKPATKNSAFRKHSPQKVFKIFETETLIRTYEMVAQWEKEVVIQEWIEGGDERVAFCLTYYDRQSHPLALFAGRKVRQYPIECGNTALSEPAPKSWSGEIIDITDAIFRRVGYRGLGSMEFKMRLGSDIPVIMEPTVGRTDFQNEVAVLNGQNIPAIAYSDLVGEQPFPAACRLRPWKLIDGAHESKAAWQYFRMNRLSIGQWFKDRRGKKKYMLLRAGDTGPYWAIYTRLITRVFRKGVKTVRSIVGQN